MKFPIKVPAIRVKQPLGEFYITSLPASLILKVSYVVEARILNDDEDNKKAKHEDTFLGTILDKLSGTQRVKKTSRLEEIRKYSETVDAGFPNSIILGANYNVDGTLNEDTNKQWFIEKGESECYTLIIPSEDRLASIIDGQHRVFGLENSKLNDMPLVCSIFLDLPIPYHAQIFTTINMNQQKVDKNLAYNLFQFDMDVGKSYAWSPETLAVYFARILTQNEDSPLHNKLRLGIAEMENETSISMASVIDGILSLITTNPKKDRIELHTKTLKEGRNRLLLADSAAPLRRMYLENKDKTLYNLILNYLKAVDKILWVRNYSIFNKTLGIQALFDVLKEVIIFKGINYPYTEEFFLDLLQYSERINFNDDFFGIQSKVRARVKKSMLFACHLKKIHELDIKENEIEAYKKVLAIE
ncbi:MAG: DGQHR domain-containing protein [Sulfuricurvum sp.]|uniref:DGQHR domain-containing protein n=1 Tax=Sulfuricurvum sp. TaxID=2025608 RepID=UPI0026345690|nr:DGQHR domain-containing protein [Sulfuricurvum sp.]MDD5161107.1 DGQHR domain-containing protein [Sulfuricurvum sp.]